jgi:hypothetical protein
MIENVNIWGIIEKGDSSLQLPTQDRQHSANWLSAVGFQSKLQLVAS